MSLIDELMAEVHGVVHPVNALEARRAEIADTRHISKTIIGLRHLGSLGLDLPGYYLDLIAARIRYEPGMPPQWRAAQAQINSSTCKNMSTHQLGQSK